jgi:hypothetical protein
VFHIVPDKRRQMNELVQLCAGENVQEQ